MIELELLAELATSRVQSIYAGVPIVASLWRYPVKYMIREELNPSVTERWIL